MDFDLTKENIQPLRGGRNISQLEIALQAQSNRERERELLLQKEHFENLIRTYEGDDPLDNWYHYISWIEQSYPKHGHEGNLLPLLEHCLGKFENDKRYTNDRRFCKLWIKYIDLQKNPLELFQMMYARGLCRGCADLYRAWAYYHEAAEDFHNANLVFEYGRRELAQPFDELEIAHNNLFMAAGQHVLLGKDDRRLQEKRQALTSLHTYKPGKVGSVRTASGSAGTFASGQIRKTNVQVPVYEDFSDIRSAGAAPMSILTVAKREDAPKENTLKPGPWTTYPVKKGGHKMPPFTVHEDDEVMNVEGLRLPPDSFPKSTLEDFSSWHVNLTIAEAVDSNVVPMYPKLKVYSLPSSEYSLEEIRGVRYRQKMQSFSVPHGSFVSDVSQVSLGPQQVINVCDNHGEFKSPYNNSPSFQHKQYHMQSQPYVNDKFNPQHISSTEIHHVVVNQSNSLRQEPPSEFMGQIHSHQSNCIDEANKLAYKDQLSLQHSSVGWPQEHSLARKSPVQNKTHTSNYDIWNSSTPDASPKVKIVNEREPFSIYEQSNFTIGQPQPKVNAMKTPFRVLSADELAETGSRGGMDVAVTAQPIDSAARLLPQLSDERSTSSFEEMCNSNPVPTDLNTSCDTQMFNFNLNVMQVSTPQHEQLQRPEQREINGLTKKQLFSETGSEKSEKVLSTIFEETRSFGSSSGSSAATKSLIPSNQVTNTNMGTISEEHNSYLAQNLMANAALRSSLLGDLMDFDTHQPMQASPIHSQQASPVRVVPQPTDVKPLEQAPSDPFKQQVIKSLLEREVDKVTSEVNLDFNSISNDKFTPEFEFKEVKPNMQLLECPDIDLGEKKSDGKIRKGRKKKDYCLFCKHYVLNFARHMLRNHSVETEVQKIVSLPPQNKTRKKLLRALRKKGNFLIRKLLCKPLRQPPYGRKIMPCVDCMGFYSAKLLWRHRKSCSGKKGKHLVESQNMLVKNTMVDQQLMEIVFPRMRPDEISLVAKEDFLICAFGARYLKERHRKKYVITVTSRRMRELARLLIEVRKETNFVNSLIEVLKPQYFNLLVQSAKAVSHYNEFKETNESISTAMSIGTSIKQCCEVAINFVQKKNRVYATSAETESDLKALIHLMRSQWRFEFTHAAEGLNTKESNKKKMQSIATDCKSVSEAPLPSTSKLCSKKGKRILIPWTIEQKDEVCKFFSTHIKKKQAPKKYECLALKERFPEVFINKTWEQIKVYVQNTYKKQ